MDENRTLTLLKNYKEKEEEGNKEGNGEESEHRSLYA
jgi:hypothetical protein